jgi:hypothetical protein
MISRKRHVVSIYIVNSCYFNVLLLYLCTRDIHWFL